MTKSPAKKTVPKETPPTPQEQEVRKIQEASRQIEKLAHHYGSLKNFLNVLHAHPSFETIHRSTIYRWKSLKHITDVDLDEKRSQIDLAKALEAIRWLQIKRDTVPLSVGIPKTLQVLPAMIVLWNDLAGEMGQPFGALEQAGVRVEIKEGAGGRDVLELLNDGLVDVAFAAEEVVSGYLDAEQGFNWCQVTEAHWSGVARQRIRKLEDLKGKTVGYLPATAMEKKLESLKSFALEKGINFNLFPSPNVEDFVNGLLNRHNAKKVDAVFGWEPLLSQVNEEVIRYGGRGKALETAEIEQALHKKYSVKVRLCVGQRANPRAVREFLHCLTLAMEYVQVEKNREVVCEACLRKVGKEWELVREMVLETLKTTSYGFSDFNPEAVLKFWGNEVKRKDANFA